MAIIKPSKKFAGSNMDPNGGGKYLKPEVRQVSFAKGNHKDGVYLYFLPAYKVDNTGAGVWFKVISIRDNFGEKFKDKYVVNDGPDPVAHFERNFKLLYPEDAAVVEELNEKTGRPMKRYPNYGRVTKRVLFNVAYTTELEKGAHVLDLPAFNGANILMKWMEAPDSRGRERALINDPERCVPVRIKLNDGGGAPWEIAPDPTDPGALPDQLADSDYLYNLDDVFVRKTNQELIQTLKDSFPPDVFEQCIEGFAGFGNGGVKAPAAANPIAVKPVVDEVAKPAKSAPALKNIPKAKTATTPAPAPVAETSEVEEDDIPFDEAQQEVNPIAGISVDAAREFLKRK